jgi:MYXO-CTERM domain-containing protein
VHVIVATAFFVAWAPPARADVDAAEVDAATEGEDASDGASDAIADVASPDASPNDAAPDGPPPYDAGDGIVPLDELPLWSPQEDNYGCSCRSVGGSTKAAAAAGVPWMLVAFACLRRRRPRR